MTPDKVQAFCPPSRSQQNTYRVYVGKYNLVEEEAGSKAMTPEKIIVHEKWNPIFVAFG